jgi:hypothetical protein
VKLSTLPARKGITGPPQTSTEATAASAIRSDTDSENLVSWQREFINKVANTYERRVW